MLGMATACMGGSAKLDPVYLRFDQLTANYQCSLEHSVYKTVRHDDLKIEVLRNGKVVRTDTTDVVATPFNFTDSGLDGESVYEYKTYWKQTDMETGFSIEGAGILPLWITLTATPRYVWGTLPKDDTIDGYMAEGIDFALNIPAGKTLTINDSAVNAGGQLDVYGAINLNKVELYGIINVMGNIKALNVKAPSQSARGEIWLNSPVSISGPLMGDRTIEGALVRINPGAAGSSISGSKGLFVNASANASFSDNTDLSVAFLATAKNITINGGTVKDIGIHGPASGSSMNVANAQINGLVHQGEPDMSGWKSGGQLIFTNCVINPTLKITSPIYPDDTQFKDCKFHSGNAVIDGGCVSIYGGKPKFTSCHFVGRVVLSGRTAAVFDGNKFRERMHLLSYDTGPDNPPWHEASSIAPVITNNSFLGLAAIQYGDGATGEQYPAVPIEIGANYYGDPNGPGMSSFLANLGANVNMYSPRNPRTQIFAFPNGHNQTGGQWADDEVFPLLWTTGCVVGQNSIPYQLGTGLLAQGKESLLSVQVVTSHDNVAGMKVIVEFDGNVVPEIGSSPILRRDISGYPPDGVSNGCATFDFILPPPAGATATLKIWQDDTDVTHADILNEKRGRVLLSDRTLAFRAPPTRQLRLILRPMWIYGYATPSAAAFQANLQPYFPSLLGVRQQDISYTIGMTEILLIGDLTGMSTEALWQALRNRCRNALSLTGLVEQIDFSVIIMPPGSMAAIFGGGTDGLNVDPYRGAIYVDAGAFEATIHEFGHAGPELYTDTEQYDLPAYQNSGGMPLTACALFNNDNAASGPFDPGSRFRHLPGDAASYSWTCSRECVDVMGSQGANQTWINYGTLDALTEYIYALAPTAAKTAKTAPAPVPPGKKRIMLWSLSEKDPANPPAHRILSGTLRAFNITSVPCQIIAPGSAPGNEVIAYGPSGAPLFSGSYAILENNTSPTGDNYYWTGTYDIPEESVRLVVKDARGTVFDIQSYGAVTSELTAPKTGDTLGDSVRFEWNATAWASGQPLQHLLLLSPDGGTTWLDPVFVEKSSSYETSTEGVPISGNLVARLVSSDGLRDSQTEIGGVKIGARAPLVKIISPLDGQISDPGFTWTLKGSAMDVDGDMTDSPVWESSLDGKLGKGDVLSGVILSAGEHVLTFSTSDSGGRSAATAVTVKVATAPLATVDLSLEPDALRVIIPGKGPVSSSWASLEPGLTHRAEMLFRNTGTTVDATLTLSLKTPAGASSELAAKTVTVQTFGTYTLNAEFIPDAKGEYVLTGKVEAVKPPDPDRANNERSWSYAVRSQAKIDFETAGDGVGTVTSTPAGAGAGTGTLGLFDLGTQVIMTAVPAAGSVFTGWSGDLGGADISGEVAVIGNLKVTATFKAGHQLTVVNGAGSGYYLTGQSVTITAEPPSARRVFKNWTATAGSLADANAPSTTFTMPAADATVTANFIQAATYHSADYNPADWQIDIFELLRVVTLFNNGLYYHVDATSLDGFSPSPTQAGFVPGTYHAADFNPADGRIDVFEMLRVVTLFNNGMYYKFDPGGIDGYSPSSTKP